MYTRDQQITTGKGIVMARLRSSVRELEVALMRFCFDKLGARLPPATRPRSPPRPAGQHALLLAPA